MGKEVKRHANWKTIEEESREFVTIVNYVREGLPKPIVEEDL
jgi:hypothetical protein